ncbi:PIF1-like protein, partial [Mya arenaria]
MEIACIFPTRAAVCEQNNQCLDEQQSNVYIVHPEHVFGGNDQAAGQNCPPLFIPTDDRDAGNMPNVLRFSIGSRVMLLRNLDITVGLVNGAIGTVHAVSLDNSGDISDIFIHFDDIHLPQHTQNENQNIVAISMIEHTFPFAGRSITRRTFPLTLSWACTIHKVQGMTISESYVDIGSSIFQPGMTYVALSRVTTLQGLHLLRLDTKKIMLMMRCPGSTKVCPWMDVIVPDNVSPLKRFHDKTLSSKFLRLFLPQEHIPIDVTTIPSTDDADFKADKTTVEEITVIAAKSAYSYQACDKPNAGRGSVADPVHVRVGEEVWIGEPVEDMKPMLVDDPVSDSLQVGDPLQ